ncbi:MAG TPA: hypothetical protein VFS08_21190 [Gemmatimonadaceae bacterium]|nr:hypothetical protein [Gemmatimonadaceae bacterium]
MLATAAACRSASPLPARPAPLPDPSPAAAGGVELESADLWNYPNRNFFRCVVLRADSARLRFADGRPVAARGAYEVRTSATRYQGAPGGATSTDRMSCRPGQIRLDAHEALRTARGLLHFHKGGQGYADSRVPYGHIAAADIVGGEAVATQRPLSLPPEWGAPSAASGGGWDDEHRNGRGCTPMPGAAYRVAIVPQGSPDALPGDWQYKPNQTGSRYAKYADAGPEQGDGTAHYAYLVWSWMLRGDGVTKSGGGGMVRALLRDGQPFLRCAVRPIDGIAYAPGSTTEIGRVTAVYGKTRASAGGPWVYGWAVFAHRPKLADGGYGPDILHMRSDRDAATP